MEMELTILMPCLNEAETLGTCIDKAQTFLREKGIEGEVLVSDNGSTDNSVQIAREKGARVVCCKRKGYGAALINGCQEAKGRYVIMGDADDSYDFLNLMPFLEKLRDGYDLVMGNRFTGGIEKAAMPWSHRYIGNPVLSKIGRIFFNSNIGDFHCGLRGYNREAMLALGLQTPGMEYASEMVIKAEINKLKITEVPTTLKKDGRSRPPHLRSVRDGWRHLRLLLMYSPKWLFLYPSIVIAGLGITGSVLLILGRFGVLNSSKFSINTLLYLMTFIVLGYYGIASFLIVKIYAYNHNFLPSSERNWNKILRGDVFIFVGLILIMIGFVMSITALVLWHRKDFGPLMPEEIMVLTIPAVAIAVMGVQSFFTGFIIGIVKVKIKDE